MLSSDYFQSIVYPLLTLATVLLFILKPQLSDWLGQEDFVVENITAISALVAALIISVLAFKRLFRNKKTFIVALLMSLGFFIIGMEEISWGQRVFNIESGQFFLDNNDQDEINFHNLHTDLTMALFYIVTFLAFVIIPFFKDFFVSILKKLKLKELQVFIPSYWITIIFASSVGFTVLNPGSQYQTISLIVTLMVLVYFLFNKLDSVTEYRPAIILTLIITLIVVSVVVSLPYEELGVRPWFYTEWREMLVCITILVYSIDLAFRVETARFSDTSKPKTTKRLRHQSSRH